jgi:hypothetical protein
MIYVPYYFNIKVMPLSHASHEMYTFLFVCALLLNFRMVFGDIWSMVPRVEPVYIALPELQICIKKRVLENIILCVE